MNLKAGLLARLQEEWAAWNQLLVQIGETCIRQPGVIGLWFGSEWLQTPMITITIISQMYVLGLDRTNHYFKDKVTVQNPHCLPGVSSSQEFWVLRALLPAAAKPATPMKWPSRRRRGGDLKSYEARSHPSCPSLSVPS